MGAVAGFMSVLNKSDDALDSFSLVSQSVEFFEENIVKRYLLLFFELDGRYNNAVILYSF